MSHNRYKGYERSQAFNSEWAADAGSKVTRVAPQNGNTEEAVVLNYQHKQN